MAVRLQDDLLDSIESEPGDLVLMVHAPTDTRDEVRAAIGDAAHALGRLAHPEEPEDAWPTLATADDSGAVPALRVDLKDRSAYPGTSALVVGVLVAALARADLDCSIALPDRSGSVRAAADPGGPADGRTPIVSGDSGGVRGTAEMDGEGMVGPPARADRPAPSSVDVHAFPWPADWLPLVRQTGSGGWEMSVMVPRPAQQVLDELTQTVSGRGTLTAAGQIQRPPHPWVLLCDLNGQGYVVSVVALAAGLTQLGVVTPARWSEMSPDERASADRDTVWTVPPR